MIILDCEQLSEEWFAARCGIPSASRFDKLITPTGKPSTSATAYRRELLAEWVTGEKQQIKQSEWMLRGIEMEPEARQYYEFTNDVEVQEVGLIFKDEDRLVSCSPDGLLVPSDALNDALDGFGGGLEIKCPAPGTHVGYLIDNKLPTAYVPQVQGSMYVTGLDYWDFMSYCPGIDTVLIRVERDTTWLAKFAPILDSFLEKMLKEREILIERGICQ